MTISGTGAAVHLEFPKDKVADGENPDSPPPHAGTAALLNGNQWCRQVGDVFRLHGPDPEKTPTVLRWAGVRLSGTHHLSGMVKCSVPNSVPVNLTVRRGTSTRRWSGYDSSRLNQASRWISSWISSRGQSSLS